MDLFFIRQKSTGFYMPMPLGRQGRGGSHMEPDADSSKARIFRTERAAKIALNTWCKGKFVADRYTDHGHPGNDWEVDYVENISVVPVPSRSLDDMEVVKRTVVLD